MTKADSVYITPPTNTSATDHPRCSRHVIPPGAVSSPWPRSRASSVPAPLPLLPRWTRASPRP
jgi:hypothetical protein